MFESANGKVCVFFCNDIKNGFELDIKSADKTHVNHELSTRSGSIRLANGINRKRSNLGNAGMIVWIGSKRLRRRNRDWTIAAAFSRKT